MTPFTPLAVHHANEMIPRCTSTKSLQWVIKKNTQTLSCLYIHTMINERENFQTGVERDAIPQQPLHWAFCSVQEKIPPFCMNVAKGKDLSDFESGFTDGCQNRSGKCFSGNGDWYDVYISIAKQRYQYTRGFKSPTRKHCSFI